MTANSGKSGSNFETPSKKKESVFRDVEDVISIGALMRPTLTQAIGELTVAQKKELREILIEVEKALSASTQSFTARFTSTQEILKRTFGYAPIWRFIAGRIEEIWRESPAPSVKELSVVSLLVGMMFEEVETRLASPSKARRSA